MKGTGDKKGKRGLSPLIKVVRPWNDFNDVRKCDNRASLDRRGFLKTSMVSAGAFMTLPTLLALTSRRAFASCEPVGGDAMPCSVTELYLQGGHMWGSSVANHNSSGDIIGQEGTALGNQNVLGILNADTYSQVVQGLFVNDSSGAPLGRYLRTANVNDTFAGAAVPGVGNLTGLSQANLDRIRAKVSGYQVYCQSQDDTRNNPMGAGELMAKLVPGTVLPIAGQFGSNLHTGAADLVSLAPVNSLSDLTNSVQSLYQGTSPFLAQLLANAVRRLSQDQGRGLASQHGGAGFSEKVLCSNEKSVEKGDPNRGANLFDPSTFAANNSDGRHTGFLNLFNTATLAGNATIQRLAALFYGTGCGHIGGTMVGINGYDSHANATAGSWARREAEAARIIAMWMACMDAAAAYRQALGIPGGNAILRVYSDGAQGGMPTPINRSNEFSFNGDRQQSSRELVFVYSTGAPISTVRNLGHMDANGFAANRSTLIGSDVRNTALSFAATAAKLNGVPMSRLAGMQSFLNESQLNQLVGVLI